MRAVAEVGDISEPIKMVIKSAARRLRGVEKRAFIAEVTLELLGGNARKAEREFGWGRETVRKGLRELATRIRCVDNYGARGNKKTEEKFPGLLYDLDIILGFDGRLNPEFRSYFPGGKISPRSVRAVLIREFEYPDDQLPNENTIGNMLGRLGYRCSGE